MNTKKKLFTDKEIEALKIARGILNRVQKKYDHCVEKNRNLSGDDFLREEAKLDNWLDQLFMESKIDVSPMGNVFIKTNKEFSGVPILWSLFYRLNGLAHSGHKSAKTKERN